MQELEGKRDTVCCGFALVFAIVSYTPRLKGEAAPSADIADCAPLGFTSGPKVNLTMESAQCAMQPCETLQPYCLSIFVLNESELFQQYPPGQNKSNTFNFNGFG